MSAHHSWLHLVMAAWLCMRTKHTRAPGIMGKLAKPHEVPHANWADVMAVNLEGSYNAARACYPHMAKVGAV